MEIMAELDKTVEQKLNERELNPTEQAFVNDMVGFYEGIAKKAGLADADIPRITDLTRVFMESKIRGGEIEVKGRVESEGLEDNNR